MMCDAVIVGMAVGEGCMTIAVMLALPDRTVAGKIGKFKVSVSKTDEVPALFREPARAERIALLASSYHRLIGKPLIPQCDDIVAGLWNARFALLAHGTEPDPVFFFGNACAIAVFESDVASFTAMPSRLSAEAPLREERQALLDRVKTQGFIDDYAGVRITATGKRFRIGPAVVWNLIDAQGCVQGQAATFVP
ncbi:conserved hypothetical protein [Novosphingobium sp. KN65.2]|nr:conserved hypothetical protein [Novosphingobium sp. KN65.2]